MYITEAIGYLWFLSEVCILLYMELTQERWETSGAEYVQDTDSKTAAPGNKIQVDAAGGVHAASQTANLMEDTEEENQHRVRPAFYLSQRA